MPAIIVERYMTGRYATNAQCQATYVKALERLGQADAANTVNANPIPPAPGTPSSLSNEQMQAIAQAVAARSGGATAAVRSGGPASSGNPGGKEAPLYVVVDESRGATIFRWVKFVFTFGLVAWLSMIVIMLLVESSGMLRRASGNANNEAKPEHQKARFSDVHGCDEAKEELHELV